MWSVYRLILTKTGKRVKNFLNNLMKKKKFAFNLNLKD